MNFWGGTVRDSPSAGKPNRKPVRAATSPRRIDRVSELSVFLPFQEGLKKMIFFPSDTNILLHPP